MFYKKIAAAALLSLSMGPAGAATGYYYPAVSAADLESFFGLAPDAITSVSGDPSIDPAFEGSGIKETFSFVAGDVISFDYNFMTDEQPPEVSDDYADDYAFVTVGSHIERLNHVLGSDPFSASYPYARETGYLSFSYTAPQSGTLDFGIGIVDAFDELYDSALLIDNLKIVRDGSEVYANGFEALDPLVMMMGDVSIGVDYHGIISPTGDNQLLIATTAVPLPPAVWLLLSGMVALMGFSRHRRRAVEFRPDH